MTAAAGADQPSGPLAPLPPGVMAYVYALLAPRDLAAIAQSCRAWRSVPLAALQRLVLPPPGRAFPLCRALGLRELVVRTNRCAAWRAALAMLREAQLPALRQVVIEYWGDEPGMLDDLADAMRVQGTGCRLSLAVTDRGALSGLAVRLPFPGLEHVDVNLPYLHEQACSQIARIVELSGGHNTLPGGDGGGSGGGGGPRSPSAVGPTVGVWVCCWGGCPGLALSAALDLRRRVGRRLVGLESVGCGGAADVAALAAAVPGLTSLGFNLLGMRAFPGPPRPAAAAAADAGALSGCSGSAARPQGLPLRVLAAAAAGGLRRLTVHGTSQAGWDCGAEEEDAGAAGRGVGGGAHGRRWPGLAGLAGLTKLSLARDWGPCPMPVAPLALGADLGSTLAELTIERRRLAAPGELSLIGRLTALTSLSVTLDAEPHELCGRPPLPSLPRGSPLAERWHAGTPATTAVATAGGGGGGSSVAAHDLTGLLAGLRVAEPPVAQGAGPERCGNAAVAGLSFADAELPWLCSLRRLRVLRLAAPLLDLAWLPPSLEELEALKFCDASATWVACSTGDGGGHSGAATAAAGSSYSGGAAVGGGGGAESGGSSGVEGSQAACGDGARRPPAAAPPPLLPRLVRLALPPLGGCGGEGEGWGSDEGGERGADGGSPEQGAPREEDALLQAIAAACPALEDLCLSGWRPGAAAAAASAAALPKLRRLLLAAGDARSGAALATAVQAVGPPGLHIEVSEPPPLLYPFGSVQTR